MITPAPTNAIPLNTTVAPLAGNSTNNPTPTFTLTATSTYTPTAPQPRNIYFQTDTTNGMWTRATNTGSTAATLTATATTAALQPGIHILYFYAADGSDATSINPSLTDGNNNGNGKSFDRFTPESSSIIGGINAYSFLVVPRVNRTLFDFDGDGRVDLSLFRPDANPANSDFYIRKSSDNTLFGYSWGLPGDKLAPADYDGDGKTDIAVWREVAKAISIFSIHLIIPFALKTSAYRATF